MIIDEKWKRNAGKGKIYWWNVAMERSEAIKVKQSEMRWDNEFCRMLNDCGFFSPLFQKGNGNYRVSETSDFHPVFSV